MVSEEMPTISAQKSQPKLNPCLQLAVDIKEGKAGGHYIYCLEEDKFYHYVLGCWEPLFDIDFIGKIQEKITELQRSPLSKRKDVAENFKCVGRKKLEIFNWSTLINLQNGMLCPISKKLEEHRPDFYSTNRLPYRYDEKAECPLWMKSLNEILENDQNRVGVLQEFFGYCLTRETKQHKALLLCGESRSGKSTILNILRHVVGIDNCSSVPLKYIADPQHTPMMINKLVNIDTDVSAKAAEYEAEFKTITSGEPLQTNQKYIQAFSFIPYCKVVMAANIFPKITDHSSAFYNRLILIPCDRVFSDEEQNRDLPVQLMNELSGIMNWAIEGLERLTTRGKFEQLEFMRDAVEELENDNNPVNLFFDEHVVIEMGATLEKGELYDRFKEWAVKNNNYQLSGSRFASCVFKRFHKQTNKNLRMPNNGKRIWRNLKYIYEKQDGSQQVDWQE